MIINIKFNILIIKILNFKINFTPYGQWEKFEYDSNRNRIYYENFTGVKCFYDSDGNRIYYEDSDGKKCFYDSDGKEYTEQEWKERN